MLKLRDNIDLSDPNAIDSLWREFFPSENQIVLSEALCKEASRFLVYVKGTNLWQMIYQINRL